MLVRFQHFLVVLRDHFFQNKQGRRVGVPEIEEILDVDTLLTRVINSSMPKTRSSPGCVTVKRPGMVFRFFKVKFKICHKCDTL